MNAPRVALEYHQLTVHDPNGARPDDPRLVRGYRPLQWDRKPPQFKTYPGLEVTLLPVELSPRPAGQLNVQALSRLLFLSAGVVRTREMGGEEMYFRAAGSAGNLSPVEVYVLTGDLPGLDAGVYHYQPAEHGLVRLAGAPGGTPPALVLTGVPWRTAWKYRERGFRHLYWDAGTMLAHALALTEEAELVPRVELGFLDHAVAALVGADGVNEVPVAVFGLEGESALPEPGPEEVPAGHLAVNPVEFPLITESQRAGDLGSAEDVREWREAGAAFAKVVADGAGAVEGGLQGSLEAVIRQRGSCRQFYPGRQVPSDLLHAAMAWATRPVPGDFVAEGATLLEHYLAVHAVDGVEPGAYRWGAGDLAQLRAGNVRDVARFLCLGQDLGGSGAYTAFHCARLRDVVGALGSRGYRAAQLEAGIVEGRLHLFAYDRGLGATGLTFFDHEVSAFFETEALPMLVTAVGAPAYESR
nr:hypothetical protein [Actinomycetota bacterium]